MAPQARPPPRTATLAIHARPVVPRYGPCALVGGHVPTLRDITPWWQVVGVTDAPQSRIGTAMKTILAIILTVILTAAASAQSIPVAAWISAGPAAHDVAATVGVRVGPVALIVGGSLNGRQDVPPNGTAESSRRTVVYRGALYGGDVCGVYDVPGSDLSLLVGVGAFREEATAKQSTNGKLFGSDDRTETRIDGVIGVQWRPIPAALIGVGYSLVLGPSVSVGVVL